MGLRDSFANLNQSALDTLEAEVRKLREMDMLEMGASFKSTFGIGFSPSLIGANAPSLLFRFGQSFIDKAKWDLREIGITHGMQGSAMLNEDERAMRADYIRLKYEAMLLAIDQQRPQPSRSKMDAHGEAVRIVAALDEIYTRRPRLAEIQHNGPYTHSLSHCFDTNRFGNHKTQTLGEMFRNIWRRDI